MKKAEKIIETSIVSYKEQALVELKITPAEIANKVVEYMALKVLPDDAKTYKIAREALTTCVHTRTGVDKRRKELNEDDQARIKARNEAAKELVAPLAPAEAHLEKELNLEDGRKAEVKAEKARIEQARVAAIQARIIDIQRRATGLESKTTVELNVLFNSTFELEITEPVYREYTGEANKIKDETVDAIVLALKVREKLDKEDAARKVENERLEKIRMEQEAVAKVQAEERRKIEEEKAKIEADKKAEADRVARAQWEENTKRMAVAEALAKADAEAKAKAEREAQEAAEKARQAALRPDKEKLLIWAAEIDGMMLPNVTSREAMAIVGRARKAISKLHDQIEQEAAEL